MKNPATTLTLLSIFAGLGLGVAGASLVIAIQWYREAMLYDYTTVWSDNSAWVMEFLIIMAVSIVLSTICFIKLRKADGWHHDSTDQGKRRIHKIIVCSLVLGICFGVILRIVGGGVVLWYDIKVMESKGIMWLGGYIFTIKQHIVLAFSAMIGAICAWILDKEF